ncbi:hypothetical protein, partial [Klebsiella pneumoniae]|uniref:hypothetical protein n=1 Tax=Klebsiella pneumoniae TaxID=573 RepID=UPI0030139984
TAEAREAATRLKALAEAAAADTARARDLMQRSASLSGEADCPVCGQALGSAFETVQAHRAAELNDAARRQEEIDGLLRGAGEAARVAEA